MVVVGFVFFFCGAEKLVCVYDMHTFLFLMRNIFNFSWKQSKRLIIMAKIRRL